VVRDTTTWCVMVARGPQIFLGNICLIHPCVATIPTMQSPNPFQRNTFAGENWTPQLVDIPPPPETHERRPSPRAYLAGGAGPLDSLLAALSGGGSMMRSAPKTEVERIRYVPTTSEPHLAAAPASGEPPRFGRRD